MSLLPLVTPAVLYWQVYLPRVLNPKSPASPSQGSNLPQSYGTSEGSPVYSPVESDSWFRAFWLQVHVFLEWKWSGLSKLPITRPPRVETEAALSRENLQMLKRTNVCKDPNAKAPRAKFQKDKKDERNLLFFSFLVLHSLLYSVGPFSIFVIHVWQCTYSTVTLLHFC